MGAKKTDFIFFDIISKIYQHRFKEGKLPTQRDLAYAYSVSRFTIQSVLNRLKELGIIYTIQGDGIYIENSSLSNPLILNSITENSYDNIMSKMVYFKKIKASPQLATIFSVDPGAVLWECQRIRIINYQVSQLETSYLPYNLFPNLSREIIEISIQDYVLEMGYRIAYHINKYKAVSIDQKTAKLLNCKKKTPAMNIESRGLLKDGIVFEYSNIISLDYSCTYIVPFNKKVHQLRHRIKTDST